jgi:circadian clock protein KaiC
MSTTATINRVSTGLPTLPKCPSGIEGLDEITQGGLPKGRPTLVVGGAGCGKTLFAVEFLVRGIVDHQEPGVFIAFEERPEELAANVRSLGYDLDELVREGKLIVDYVEIERSQIEEAGEYDLEGLFIRLGASIDAVGAKRVALDTIEVLFGGLSDHAILRSELRRLFHWIKDRGVTAIITCERGNGGLSRHGLEEYVSDCVIVLDHRVSEQISTRRLRVVKYRGTAHGADEYPFLIDEGGITVLPVTSLGLNHEASSERISTGVPRLDIMLGGDGVYRGTTVLVSGTAGSGKTSLAAHFANATCQRGERCLYMAFEESPSQLVRNMKSVGIDLARWVATDRLRVHAARPTAHGLEMHLATIHKLVRDFRPRVVIRSDHEPHPCRHGRHRQCDAPSAGRLPQGRGRHRLLHESHVRRQRPRTDRGRRVVAGRYLAPPPLHRAERRTEPRPLRAQVARDAAFQPDPRVRPRPERGRAG